VRAAIVVAAVGMLANCSDPPPKSPRATTGEVPANSLDDSKLHPKDTRSDDEPNDPTQPYTTKVGEDSTDPTAPSGSSKPAKPGPAGTVSKAECDKAMDKYLSLEIAGNPELKGVSQDVIDQAKAMARQQHGDAPCTATRTQFKCAMAATTTAAWQKCMK
jgi:hypothetical protein